MSCHISEAIWEFWIYRCIPNLDVVMATLPMLSAKQTKSWNREAVFEGWKKMKFQGEEVVIHSLANRVCLSQLLLPASREAIDIYYIDMDQTKENLRWVRQSRSSVFDPSTFFGDSITSISLTL